MLTIERLVTSGEIVDLMLMIVAAEVVVLAALRRFRGIGPPLLAWLPGLGAGLCLMLALRASLAGAAWSAIAGWLAGALVLHLADLAVRWRQPVS